MLLGNDMNLASAPTDLTLDFLICQRWNHNANISSFFPISFPNVILMAFDNPGKSLPLNCIATSRLLSVMNHPLILFLVLSHTLTEEWLNACCSKNGTTKALNLYAALAIEKRSVCYKTFHFHLCFVTSRYIFCTARKGFFQLYITTALLRQMFQLLLQLA